MNPAILKAPTRPLIADDAGTVAHVYFKSGSLIDTRGNTWTMNGTVPQVPKAGKTPAGAGPFSAANYYSLGTGNDVLDFAGDFSAYVVFRPALVTDSGVSLINGAFGPSGAGYRISLNVGKAQFDTYATASALGRQSPANSVVTDAVNVMCCGRGGATGYCKLNLGTIVSSAAQNVNGTAWIAQLGTESTLSMPGTIYEVLVTTTAPSDALFIEIMNRVKTRAGITAW